MPLDSDYVQRLAQHGYITAAQAANPSMIPTSGSDVDWDNPQFSGLHPLADNSADKAAQAAAAPDLARGTNAAGLVNPMVARRHLLGRHRLRRPPRPRLRAPRAVSARRPARCSAPAPRRPLGLRRGG